MADTKSFNTSFDKDVIQSAINGDEASFEKIYNQYYSPSIELAYRITGNSTLAQDIAQESFFRIFGSLNQYRNDGSFSGWIRRIVRNQCINHIKKYYREEDDLENAQSTLESRDLFETDWCDARTDLLKLLAILSPESRAVLVLHEIEGLTHKEIAKIFNKTESFSKTLLSRAYKQLKNHAEKLKRSENLTNGRIEKCI